MNINEYSGALKESFILGWKRPAVPDSVSEPAIPAELNFPFHAAELYITDTSLVLHAAKGVHAESIRSKSALIQLKTPHKACWVTANGFTQQIWTCQFYLN